jgi:GNAT superfamily N-acetyltransferase
MPDLSISQALDVFLHGFSATRSFIRPYEVSQIGDAVWLLADAPSTIGPTRNSEVIAYGANPEEVQETIRSQGIGRYMLCVLLEDANEAAGCSMAYKQLGYRLNTHEPLFVLNTARRIRFDAVPIRRITQTAEANAVAKAARSRQILPQHLTEEDAACRLYAAFDGDRPIGWCSSIRTHPDRAWVSNLFVHPDYRRKGIGRTLMSAMLDDDARYGVTWSVLLASLTGAKLYPCLGYEERGQLLLFSPRKRD